jgi:hypothetical protein
MPLQSHLDGRRRMLIPASVTAMLVRLVMAAPAWSAGPTAVPAATVAPAWATRPLPGPATWPAHPQPIAAAPADDDDDDDDNGVGWATLGLTIGGGLLVASGIATLTYRRSRRPQRVRATA